VEYVLAVFVVQVTTSPIGPLLLAGMAFLIWLALARRLSGTPRPMGRFPFGILCVGIFGLLIGTGSVWLSVAERNVDLASLAFLGWTMGLALLLAWAARRRAVSIWGTTDGAVLAALPPLALILMLKPSHPRRAPRRLTRRALQIELYVVALIAAAAPGAVLTVQMQQAWASSMLSTSTLPAERAAALHAAFATALAPLRIDLATVLEGGHSDGANLTLRFRVSGDMVQLIDLGRLNAALTDTVPKAICANANYANIVSSGGSVTYAFAIELADLPSLSMRIAVDRCAPADISG
jgi:hypothetical protein